MIIASPLKTGNAVSKAVQGSPLKIRRILAPTDLSEDSHRGISYATRLAQHFAAKLTILHIYEAPFLFDDTMTPAIAQELQRDRQRAETALLGIWEESRSKHSNCDTLFQCGQPHELIVKAARDLETDLIVLSTHGYHWLNHLLFGSDAEHVLRHAPCPVLIVQEHERDFIAA